MFRNFPIFEVNSLRLFFLNAIFESSLILNMLLNSCRLIGKLNSTNAIMTEWKTTKYNGNLHQILSWRWWWCLILKQNFCARHWNSILPFLLASKSNWLRYWRSFSSPANEMNFLIQRYFFKAVEERNDSQSLKFRRRNIFQF